MKHFFHPANEKKMGQLNALLNEWRNLFPLEGNVGQKQEKTETTKSKRDQDAIDALKLIYDMTDVIYDKRLDNNDEELEIRFPEFLQEASWTSFYRFHCFSDDEKGINKGEKRKQNADSKKKPWDAAYTISGTAVVFPFAKKGKKNQTKSTVKLRDGTVQVRPVEQKLKTGTHKRKALEALWRAVDVNSWWNDDHNHEEESALQREEKILLHLVRGNLAIRLFQLFYDLENPIQSEKWGDTAIEILWHGGILAEREYNHAKETGDVKQDIYFILKLLMHLNAGAYYYIYAARNRRSNFSSAKQQIEDVVEDICSNLKQRAINASGKSLENGKNTSKEYSERVIVDYLLQQIKKPTQSKQAKVSIIHVPIKQGKEPSEETKLPLIPTRSNYLSFIWKQSFFFSPFSVRTMRGWMTTIKKS